MEKIETENIDLKVKLMTDFQALENSLNGEAGSSFHNIRQDAIANFNAMGFPVKKHEEWKYTNINPILKHNFIQAFDSSETDLKKEDIKNFVIKTSGINLLVFVNGRFEKGLSDIVSNDDKVFIGNFSDAQKKFTHVIENHFAKYADYKTHSLVALNTAFAKDGAFIYVPKNCEIRYENTKQ